ncbi:MAG: hypothetical protein U9N62_11120, partial [Thermotogota bacterium]|nr:hypothetical protein [Thermotogota bacterium]
MNIAKGTAAAISLQSLAKKNEGKDKTGAYLGKVIAKSGKEIQVLINDKVYEIEPGNAQSIKIGDKIQVYFGKDLPQQISEEMLQRISGKLIDVFSLSLPYSTTKELENLINQMPQIERLQFAKISNEMVQIVESILKEEFSVQTENTSGSTKNSFNLFDPELPYNRRLVELSLKAKEMGKAWEQIPDNIKKEIIKKYVLFDLQKQKADSKSNTFVQKNSVIATEKDSKAPRNTLSQSIEKHNIGSPKGPEVEVKTLELKNNKSEQDIFLINQKTNEAIKNDGNLKKAVIMDKVEKSSKVNKEPISKTFVKQIPLKTIYHDRNLTDNLNLTRPKTPLAQEGSKLESNQSNNQSEGSLKVSKTNTNVQQNSSGVQSIDSNRSNSSINMNNEKIFFTKDDIKILTKILENSISKPLSIEKNLDKLEKVMNSNNFEKSKTDSVGTTIKQVNVSKDVENIMQLIKNISLFEDSSKSFALNNASEQKIDFWDYFSADNFEKLTRSPLMDVEIKNMIFYFKNTGIPERDAFNTTLDIVNLASRANREEYISTQLYSMSLKKYLKVKLPQLIVNNNISQKSENELINKIESFSKKAFVIVKSFSERFLKEKQSEVNPLSEKSSGDKAVPKGLSEAKLSIDFEKDQKITREYDHQINSKTKEKSIGSKINSEKQVKGAIQKELSTSGNKNQETTNNQLNVKKEGLTEQIRLKIENDKSIQNESKLQTQNRSNEHIQKNDYSSERILKFLNISSEKTDFSNPYSSIITLNEQPFVIDFHHQKMDNGGYEKNEMYRVFIETNTQLFGTVFVDTMVSN